MIAHGVAAGRADQASGGVVWAVPVEPAVPAGGAELQEPQHQLEQPDDDCVFEAFDLALEIAHPFEQRPDHDLERGARVSVCVTGKPFGLFQIAPLDELEHLRVRAVDCGQLVAVAGVQDCDSVVHDFHF